MVELRALLAERGLATEGNKAALITRLQDLLLLDPNSAPTLPPPSPTPPSPATTTTAKKGRKPPKAKPAWAVKAEDDAESTAPDEDPDQSSAPATPPPGRRASRSTAKPGPSQAPSPPARRSQRGKKAAEEVEEKEEKEEEEEKEEKEEEEEEEEVTLMQLAGKGSKSKNVPKASEDAVDPKPKRRRSQQSTSKVVEKKKTSEKVDEGDAGLEEVEPAGIRGEAIRPTPSPLPEQRAPSARQANRMEELEEAKRKSAKEQLLRLARREHKRDLPPSSPLPTEELESDPKSSGAKSPSPAKPILPELTPSPPEKRRKGKEVKEASVESGLSRDSTAEPKERKKKKEKDRSREKEISRDSTEEPPSKRKKKKRERESDCPEVEVLMAKTGSKKPTPPPFPLKEPKKEKDKEKDRYKGLDLGLRKKVASSSSASSTPGKTPSKATISHLGGKKPSLLSPPKPKPKPANSGFGELPEFLKNIQNPAPALRIPGLKDKPTAASEAKKSSSSTPGSSSVLPPWRRRCEPTPPPTPPPTQPVTQTRRSRFSADAPRFPIQPPGLVNLVPASTIPVPLPTPTRTPMTPMYPQPQPPPVYPQGLSSQSLLACLDKEGIQN